MPGSLARPTRAGRSAARKGLRDAGILVRRGMIQLAWRFLMFQKDSALAQWFRARTASAESAISFEYHDLCSIRSQRERRAKTAQGATDDSRAERRHSYRDFVQWTWLRLLIWRNDLLQCGWRSRSRKAGKPAHKLRTPLTARPKHLRPRRGTAQSGLAGPLLSGRLVWFDPVPRRHLGEPLLQGA
jgi:hypothetical protein